MLNSAWYLSNLTHVFCNEAVSTLHSQLLLLLLKIEKKLLPKQCVSAKNEVRCDHTNRIAENMIQSPNNSYAYTSWSVLGSQITVYLEFRYFSFLDFSTLMCDPIKVTSEKVLIELCAILGSTTACLVSLDALESKVHAVNLGDSGYMIVRDGKVLLRSQEQQHYFNTPFQLTLVPPAYRSRVLSDRSAQLTT